MRTPRSRRLALLVALLVVTAGCASAPPHLSPVGHAAFVNTRVIKGLDLLRDSAVEASAQQPPLVSLATTRKVVLYHESTLKIIHAAGTGWQAVVLTGLDELLKDVPAKDHALLQPYVALTKTILLEAQ